MVQIVNNPGAGGRLGAAFGTGISQALQNLANQKMQQIQQAHIAEGYKSAGLPEWLAQLPQGAQGSIAAKLFQDMQNQQALDRIYGNQNQSYANQQFSPGMQELMAGVQTPRQPEYQAAEGEFSGVGNEQQATPQQPQLSERQLAELSFSYPQLERAMHHRQLERQGQQKIDLRQQELINKENSGFTNWLSSELRNAPVIANKLNRLESLLSTGDVATGLFSKLPNALQSEATQEANSIINELFTLFSQPGSATGLKGQALLGSLPSLTNTPGGIQRLISSLRALSNIPKIYADTKNQIIKNNKGREPRNLEQQVYELASPRVEQYLSRYSEPEKKTRQKKEGQPSLPVEKVQEAAESLGISSPIEFAKQYFNEDSEASRIARDDMRLESDLADIDKTAKRDRMLKAKEQAQSLPSYAPQQDFGGEFGAGDAYSHAQDAKYIASRIAQGAGEGITGLATLPFSAANVLSGGKIPVPQAVQTIQQLPARAVRAVAGDLQPETETGERFGEVAGDIASLVSPGGLLSVASKGLRAAKAGSKFIDTAAKILKITPASAAKVAGSGGFAKWGAEKLGATPGQAEAVKSAAMLAVPLFGFRGISNQVNQLEQATATAAQGKYVKPGSSMNVLFKAVANAGPELSEEQQAITNALKNMHGTEMPVSEVLKIQQAATTPRVKQAAESLLEAASKQHPEFGTALREFNELSNAAQTSSVIQSFMQDKALKYAGRNPIMTALLSSLGMTRSHLAGPGLAVGGAAMVAGQAEKIVKLALTSPAWRKTYGDLIKAALAGEAQLANKAIANMDKVIAHEEKKGKL